METHFREDEFPLKHLQPALTSGGGMWSWSSYHENNSPLLTVERAICACEYRLASFTELTWTSIKAGALCAHGELWTEIMVHS